MCGPRIQAQLRVSRVATAKVTGAKIFSSHGMGGGLPLTALSWLLARFTSSLAAGKRCLSGVCHVLPPSSAHNRTAGSRQGERVCPRRKPQSFNSMILEVTAHSLCFILLVRSKSLNPVLGRFKRRRLRLNTRAGNQLGYKK